MERRRTYRQFSLEERCSIARLHEDGQSVRQIASSLDRSASSVAREIKRNASRQKGYWPAYAQEQSQARRWKGSRFERKEELRKIVLEKLRLGWSPEQAAGFLRKKNDISLRISYESIYRFVYAQMARKKDYRWRHYLPRAKCVRGWRKRISSVDRIAQRVPISERSVEVMERKSAGHWEADLMLFSKYGQAVLAIHERLSRLLVLYQQPNKGAKPVADHLIAMLGSLPKELRQSITFDNGTEFSEHYRLRDQLQMQTFFCDPYAPWQKGGIENAIGRMRRLLPRKTDLASITQEQLNALARIYNHTPRKCLDFKPPVEIFLSHLLHFKCESTSPTVRE